VEDFDLAPFVFKLQGYQQDDTNPDDTLMIGFNLETNESLSLRIDAKSSKRWQCNMARLSDHSNSSKYTPPGSVLYVGGCKKDSDIAVASYVKVMSRNLGANEKVVKGSLMLNNTIRDTNDGKGGCYIQGNLLDDKVHIVKSKKEIFSKAQELLDPERSGSLSKTNQRGFMIRVIPNNATSERNVVHRTFVGGYKLSPEENMERIFSAKPKQGESKNTADKILDFAEKRAFGEHSQARVELVGFYRVAQFYNQRDFAEKQKGQRDATFRVSLDSDNGVSERYAYSDNVITLSVSEKSGTLSIKDYRRMEMSPKKSLSGLVGCSSGSFKGFKEIDSSDKSSTQDNQVNDHPSLEFASQQPDYEVFARQYEEMNANVHQHEAPHYLDNETQENNNPTPLVGSSEIQDAMSESEQSRSVLISDINIDDLIPDLHLELDRKVERELINLPSKGVRLGG